MDKLWGDAKSGGKLLKFGGGFYAGKLPAPSGPIRKRSTMDGMSAAALANELDELRGFIDGSMPPKKAELLALRSGVNSAVATRQVQRFEGERPSNMPRINELLPQPVDPKYRLAVIEFLVPGAKNGGSDKGPNGHRIDSIPIANGVIKTGNACDILRYDASNHAAFVKSLAPYDALHRAHQPGAALAGHAGGNAGALRRAHERVSSSRASSCGRRPTCRPRWAPRTRSCKIANLNCGLPDTLAYYTEDELDEGFKQDVRLPAARDQAEPRLGGRGHLARAGSRTRSTARPSATRRCEDD